MVAGKPDNHRLRQLFSVVKIAEICNLQCPYCYFFFGKDGSFADDPAKMSLSTIRRTAEFLVTGAEELETRKNRVISGWRDDVEAARRTKGIVRTDFQDTWR